MSVNTEFMHIINGVFEKYRRLVDPVIKRILADGIDDSTKKLVFYQIDVGGKRLRPILAILSCLACGGRIKDVLYAAAGLEILHTYTLIIDDIIDHSSLRRGNNTTWVQFGKSIAQCIAIAYSADVFNAAARTDNFQKVSSLYIKALKTISQGEILDILFERMGREEEQHIYSNRYRVIQEEDYFHMVGMKTAGLLEISCEVGAICADANLGQMNALKNYGFNLGIAFQISDDILDIFGNEQKFGKKIGKDFIEKKGGNIIILYSLEELPSVKRSIFENILRKKHIISSDIKKLIKIIQTTSALPRALKTRALFIRKAKRSLSNFPNRKEREMLLHIGDMIARRES